MRVYRRAKELGVGSDREVLIMFVTSDGEGTARNLVKWYKVM
jgi:hypothetical protein